MYRASASSTASTADLWAVVTDVTRWPDHLDTFTSITPAADSPVASGVGARFDVRQPGLAATVYEVTEWEPTTSFVWVSRSAGVTTEATHRIEATPAGSTVALTLDWRGPLAPLLRLAIGRRVTSMIELEASTFARIAATGNSPSTAG